MNYLSNLGGIEMSKKLSILEENIPCTLIQEEDIKLIIQDQNLESSILDTYIKTIKILIDSIPVGFIQKDTEDFNISNKISFVIIEIVGEFLRSTDSTPFYKEKTNLEAVLSFLGFLIDSQNFDPEFIEFVAKYRKEQKE